jgi:hypothetical protein
MDGISNNPGPKMCHATAKFSIMDVNDEGILLWDNMWHGFCLLQMTVVMKIMAGTKDLQFNMDS